MSNPPMRALFLLTLVLGGCRDSYDETTDSGASSAPTISSSPLDAGSSSTSGSDTDTIVEATGDTGSGTTSTSTGDTADATLETGIVDPLCRPTSPEPIEGQLPPDMLPTAGPGEEEWPRDHEAGILSCDAELEALQATFERPVEFPEVDWSQHALMWALHGFNVMGGATCMESPRSLEVDAGVVVLGVAKEAAPGGAYCNDAGTVVPFVALVPRATYDGARIGVLPDDPEEE